VTSDYNPSDETIWNVKHFQTETVGDKNGRRCVTGFNMMVFKLQ
jgi:hypothetical protein